ncbi:MAG: hypothetical protein AAGE76_08640 [Pseudomonadota bacterium]
MLIRPALLAACLWPAAAAAQAPERHVTFRDTVAACLVDDDFACAFEALMDFGAENEMPPVAVSVDGGPTLFGMQMFAVIDRARADLPPETRREMAERAISYTYDAQPDDPFAAGPFLLLYGEICKEMADRRCETEAVQALQLFWDQGLWYFPGLGDLQGENDARARADRFLSEFRRESE